MASATRKRVSGLLTACVLLILSTFALQSCFHGRKSAGGGQVSAAPPAAFTPEETRGGELFLNFCDRCHPGGMKGRGPALITKPLPGFLIKTQVRMGFGGMPAFSSKEINPRELMSIVAYLKARRAGKVPAR